jgi:hypothetical protein
MAMILDKEGPGDAASSTTLTPQKRAEAEGGGTKPVHKTSHVSS